MHANSQYLADWELILDARSQVSLLRLKAIKKKYIADVGEKRNILLKGTRRRRGNIFLSWKTVLAALKDFGRTRALVSTEVWRPDDGPKPRSGTEPWLVGREAHEARSHKTSRPEVCPTPWLKITSYEYKSVDVLGIIYCRRQTTERTTLPGSPGLQFTSLKKKYLQFEVLDSLFKKWSNVVASSSG